MTYVSIFIHVIALLLCPTTLAKNHTDHLALLAIKSTITDPQNVLESWNTSLHFCQWQGVTCGRRHPRVTELNLGSRGIVGSFSPHIGNLSFLRVNILENNTFKGAIPPQLGNLFRLQKLILNDNYFEGEVPAALSNCTRLDELRLSRNKLVGKLPQQFSSLVNLRFIAFRDNDFTGGIPSFLANLTSLEFIYGVGNPLGGSIPRDLDKLYKLQVITFSVTQLHGMIPPSLYNLTSLRVISFTNNEIIGDLPKDIGLQLPNLEFFQITANNFTGIIPFSFSNCSNLVELGLGLNGFTEIININFNQMPNLSYVGLFRNHLGKSQPDEMKFIDTMINCSNLEVLLAHNNKLGGVLPSSVGNLSSQLTILSISANSLYGAFPSGIGNLVKLEHLRMEYNQFTGILPSELANLRNLRRFTIEYNSFTGNIPNFIGNLSLLDALLLQDLSDNHLGGPVPQNIGNLKSLTTLDLSHNNLIGTIPNTIASCTSLEVLDMKENYFQGPIPQAMSALRGIRNLDLSSNNLSGMIPSFFGQLNLSTLNLAFNNLEGEVPMTGIFKNASTFAIDGNNKLCGGVPELGLPKCAVSAKGSHMPHVILVVIPVCLFLVIALVLVSLFCWKIRKTQPLPTEASFIQPFSRISYGSILKATDEFSRQNLIGSGTFSEVYKGIFEPDGEVFAIKVLKLGNQGALKSFVAECETLKNVRHRNLVKIITSCSSLDFQGNDFKALIYEFMPNGSLERWLHPSSQQKTENEEAPRRLTIRQRVTIATDVAHALHYLHQNCDFTIIHCDLKPSNILLDSEMVAHIGDFGLAKFLPLKPHQSSSIGIRGTVGYAAPEYGVGNEMTKEGDVYSFGILLLEMMTGRRPTDPVFQEGLNLHEYVKMALPERLMDIIEPQALFSTNKEHKQAPNMNHGYSMDELPKLKRLEESMISLARIGLACSMESPTDRMDTNKLVHELRHINEIFQSF
uniref:probable LRR receptor-like serine/threonine-protein kinase At3g47570 n=1 Tax=Erigeron canadensis TaxID=72917 RepID=UPI001CB98B93|nr:probable LRR receptor-like serine/threonine-protein kinase At3g47570 [Erigeron canadensis]